MVPRETRSLRGLQTGAEASPAPPLTGPTVPGDCPWQRLGAKGLPVMLFVLSIVCDATMELGSLPGRSAAGTSLSSHPRCPMHADVPPSPAKSTWLSLGDALHYAVTACADTCREVSFSGSRSVLPWRYR